MSDGVHGQIIPATLTRQWNPADDVIWGRARNGGLRGLDGKCEREQADHGVLQEFRILT